MAEFTNAELTDIVMCYAWAGENAHQARIVYRERFPNRHLPHERTFLSVVQRLRDTGSFSWRTHDRGRTRTLRILNAEEEILERIQNNPESSI